MSELSPHIDRPSTPHRNACIQANQEQRPRSLPDRAPLKRPRQSQDQSWAVKRRRVSLAKIRNIFDHDRRVPALPSDSVECWLLSDFQTTQPPDHAMDSLQDQFVRARKTPTLGKRSSGSLLADTTSAYDSTGDSTRSGKNLYRNAQIEIALQGCGSFLDDHREGMSDASRRTCQMLLNTPQDLPKDTLFSDELFPELFRLVKGENEATVVRYLLPHLVPSASVRAIRGASHLQSFKETIQAGWINAFRYCNLRPHPDYALGIKREAFSSEQLQKLKPYIVALLIQESLFNATFHVCFPFLTAEVKCGAAALDIAGRQNAVSQTVSLRGLVTLFRLAGLESQLHRTVLGFSISHDDETVRIYGHYPFISDQTTTYHRCLITSFNIAPSLESSRRWASYTFVRNLHDRWAPDHFQLICSAVNALPDHMTPSQITILRQITQNPTQINQTPTQITQTPSLDAPQAPESSDRATGTDTHPSGSADPFLTPEISATTGRKKQRTDRQD